VNTELDVYHDEPTSLVVFCLPCSVHLSRVTSRFHYATVTMHVDVQQWALLPPPSRKYTVLVKFMRKYGPSIACARIRLSHTYLFVVLSPRTTSRTAHTAKGAPACEAVPEVEGGGSGQAAEKKIGEAQILCVFSPISA